MESNRILVIDDNVAIHEDFLKILTSEDGSDDDGLAELEAALFDDAPQEKSSRQFYQVDTANQGQLGCDLVVAALAEGKPYSLAFVDMRMPPGWDGLQTIKEIWKVDPDIQIVICSAYSDYSWNEIIEQLNHSDQLLVLKKPFDNIEVSQMALALTSKWRVNRQVQSHVGALEAAVEERTASLSQAVNQLQSSREFLNSTIDSLSSRIAILDDAGLIVSANANWRTAADGNPFATQSIGDAADYCEACRAAGEGEADTLINGVRSVINAETERFSTEYSYTLPDGQEAWFVATVTFFQLSDSRRIVVAHDDVTELRQLQGQLAHAQKLEAVGQLSAGIAHEINTPVQYIGDNLSFLREAFGEVMELVNEVNTTVSRADAAADGSILKALEKTLGDADVEYLQEEVPMALSQTVDGVQRVAKIVHAMKEFSHPGEEGFTQIDLNQAIESTITVATSEWKYIADLKTEFDPDLPMVNCLPGELNQVILNLIVNASHAIADVVGPDSGEKGQITVSTRAFDKHVEIRIADSGTGIPEAIQKKVFDQFFTTKEVGKGTGQGLAMAYSIVAEQHSGRIYFESEEGKGTTFIIEIPR